MSEYEDVFPVKPDENRYTRKARRDAQHEVVTALAERLATVRDEWLIGVPFDVDAELAEAVRLARRLKRSGAKNRQIRHVARLLMQVDEAPIKAALDRAELGHGDDVDVLHASEGWRDRLLAEGPEAIEAFIEAFPAAEGDRQHMRQLVRQGARDIAAGKPARTRRTLYRLVKRFLLGGEASAEDALDADDDDDLEGA